jgi:hypothetical protein
MPDVTEERARLLKMTMPTIPALPVDLYSRGSDMTWSKFKETTPDTYIHNYPEVIDLKVNAASGVYDVVGMTNWRSADTKRKLVFAEKLGLENGKDFVVFDFWNQKLLGVFRDSMEVEIEPHDTRVFHIHKDTGRPQLVGISRHISGSYSIIDLGWDENQKILKGTSQSVPGDDYSLFIYVPSGFSAADIKATSREKSNITIAAQADNNLLRITFRGIADLADWEIRFK